MKATAVKVRESAKRLLAKEWGGVQNLTYSTVGGMAQRDTLYEGTRRTAQNTLVYTADRRAWLERRGIVARDPDREFNNIVSSVCYDMVTDYMKRHGLSMRKQGNGYKLVKTGPMRR